MLIAWVAAALTPTEGETSAETVEAFDLICCCLSELDKVRKIAPKRRISVPSATALLNVFNEFCFLLIFQRSFIA
jgi:hypothetical protein